MAVDAVGGERSFRRSSIKGASFTGLLCACRDCHRCFQFSLQAKRLVGLLSCALVNATASSLTPFLVMMQRR